MTVFQTNMYVYLAETLAHVNYTIQTGRSTYLSRRTPFRTECQRAAPIIYNQTKCMTGYIVAELRKQPSDRPDIFLYIPKPSKGK
jgi:hypothetical protein